MGHVRVHPTRQIFRYQYDSHRGRSHNRYGGFCDGPSEDERAHHAIVEPVQAPDLRSRSADSRALMRGLRHRGIAFAARDHQQRAGAILGLA
jgi:hypothetical protein